MRGRSTGRAVNPPLAQVNAHVIRFVPVLVVHLVLMHV
jgi:hypothetical protein